MSTQNHHTKASFPFSANTAREKAGITLDIAIIGAGGFAGFAAKAFLLVTAIKIIAVTDINKDAAVKMAGELNARVCHNYDECLEDENIDLVYIATPPYLHYQQSKKALLAGKHVICEKPAAFKASEAEELKSLAQSLQLLYVVNLMQRYNPLYTIVKKIIDQKILGDFLHGFFENYASDENLPQEHWFWDETKSGGIFIEHGVHFFDMFSGWLGKGKVINALQLQRPGVKNKLVDRVQASVLYHNGIVNFYHDFDQPKILDRQELRLQFEKGDITLFEWVPVKMKLQGLLQKKELITLQEMLADFTLLPNENILENQKVKGGFKDIQYDSYITIEYTDPAGKQDRYQQIVSAMVQDQWNWIKNRKHIRLTDDTTAVESTRMAEQATQIAQYLNFENT